MFNPPCESFSDGWCLCFDEDDPENCPSLCDPENGSCIDEYDDGCSDYAPEDTHCSECGNRYENCECEE